MSNADIEVSYDTEEDLGDDPRPVQIRVFDTEAGQDAPPAVEFVLNEDEAHDLEKQLNDARMVGLGFHVISIPACDVQVDDVIGDLGMTVTRTLDTASGQAHIVGGDMVVVLPEGLEIKVNRPLHARG